MGRIIALTAYSRDGQKFARPRVVYVQEATMEVVPASKEGKLTRVIEKDAAGYASSTYLVYESAMQVEAARNPSSTDIYIKQQVQLALAGAGTTQGAGTALARYLSEVTTIGDGATEAATLDAATVGKVRVVINNDTVVADDLRLFPAVGHNFEGSAVNVVKSVPIGTRIHLVCLVAGTWVVADDFGD